MSVIIVQLYNLPCGVGGSPATVLKIHSNGRGCPAHVMAGREDKTIFEATCWAFPGSPTQDSGVGQPRKMPGRSDPASLTTPAPATLGPARPINYLHALLRSA